METPLRLNAAQEQALDLGRHIALTAVAGSGKTAVLVERFVRILQKNQFRPEQIVAITFTEEAASEMRERIRNELSRRVTSRPEQDCEGADWIEALEKLPLARITTIHGFCLGLLREYPLALDLNPDCRVLPPGEQEAMLRTSVRNLIRKSSRLTSKTLEELLRYMPPSTIQGILLAMIKRRGFFGDFRMLCSSEHLAGNYRRETASILSRLAEWERLEECLAGLPPRLLLGGDSCGRRCRSQFELLRRRSDLDHETFLAGFGETLRGRVRPTAQWKDSPAYEELKQLWARLRKLLQDHPLILEGVTGEEDKHFNKAMACLHAMFRFASERYTAEKESRDVLDFDDLLELGRRLVQSAGVRQAIRERYRYFLIDEFQDTNPVQWQILEPLIGPANNFFAVGDAKQSIYRFRDADVSVFGVVKRWVAGRGRCVEMPQNYRSLPRLVEFNNRLFRSLFRGELPYEASHQEMEACRDRDTQEGQVDVFLFDEGQEMPEPRITANRIHHLIHSEGYAPGDIALLLRTRTRLKHYEANLNRLGIPFRTIGGMGFFARQEVLDLVSLMRLLADPVNEVALVGVLRSPLFNLSDEDLFTISRFSGENFRSKLKNAARVEEVGARAHWRFADSKLRAWGLPNRHLSLAERLREALRETGYLSILFTSREGGQCVANTLKLLEMVRSFESEGRRSPREFVRFVDSLIESAASEPESLVSSSSTGQSVRIYTIHGAKGLQFPVVVMPELGSPLASGPADRFFCERFTIDGEIRTAFGTKIWNPDRDFKSLAHPTYEMLRRMDQYRQVAEEKRLLYVATTRARDRLILLGRRTLEPSYSAWLEECGVSSTSEPKPFLDSKMKMEPSTRPELNAVATAAPPGAGPSLLKRHWTATELALFEKCPRKYFLSQIELRPLDTSRASLFRGRVPTVAGTAVHEILEGTPELTNATIEPLLSRWLQRRSNLPLAGSEEVRKAIRNHLSRVGSHPFYERIRQSPRRYSERSFSLAAGGFTLEGVVDCLFQESDGSWVIVDFKTDHVKPQELDEYSEQEGYTLQLEIYLWAVSQVLETSEVSGVLFYTHTGDLLRLDHGPGVDARCRETLARLPEELSREAFPLTQYPFRCEGCEFLAQGICPGGGPRQRTLW